MLRQAEIEKVMKETGMDELQAYRHVQAHRLVMDRIKRVGYRRVVKALNEGILI